MLNTDRNSEISTMDFSAAQVSRLSLPEIQQQTFSKIANLHDQLNPLITAATPLFSLALELKERVHAPDLKSLHDLLTHEVQIMEQRALQDGYRSQVILAARYLICAYIDEIISNTEWGKHSNWEHNLLSTFQHEVSGGEHFFLILERSAEEPQFFIDVLELGYICLKLGFKGKYGKKDYLLELENITDNLYQLIRQTRGEVHKKLFISSTESKPAKIKKWMWPSISSTIIAFIAILLTIFIIYHERLETLLNPIQQSIDNQLTQPNGTQQNASIQTR